MEPVATNFTFGGDNKMMFALGISNLNLNNLTTRIFDFFLTAKQIHANGTTTKTRLAMVPCTREHFAISDKVIGYFDAANIGWKVCPPLNLTF